MPSTIFMTKFLPLAAFFNADFCTEDTDHIHTGVGTKMKAEVIQKEPGVGSISGKAHLCLHSSQGEGTWGISGSDHSPLHAWLKYSLFRELRPGVGVVPGHVCAVASRASNQGPPELHWCQQGWLEKLPAPALQLDGQVLHLTLTAWAVQQVYVTSHQQARSSGEVVTCSVTSSS